MNVEGSKLGIGFTVITIMYLIYGAVNLWYAYYIGVKKVFIIMGEMTPELDARITNRGKFAREHAWPYLATGICSIGLCIAAFITFDLKYLIIGVCVTVLLALYSARSIRKMHEKIRRGVYR
ncbi:MAG: hypothetical protein ACLT0Y_05055 [Christensenellales bacterium]|jgi:uncharacterized membrane protein YdbT with pleckstrin-like domain